MSQEYYELLVLAARYVFSFLGVVVVWRAARWLRQDTRQRRKVLSALPDAGYVGTLYVMVGESKGMTPGDSLQLPMEGVLGSGSGCDVRVPHPTVGGRHALFSFQADGLHLRPYRDERLQVDDQPLPQGCEAILQHGATLTLGGVMLQLRLFAGVQVPAFAEAQAEEPRRHEKQKKWIGRRPRIDDPGYDKPPGDPGSVEPADPLAYHGYETPPPVEPRPAGEHAPEYGPREGELTARGRRPRRQETDRTVGRRRR